MQAGMSKEERKASAAARKILREDLWGHRRLLRREARVAKKLNAQSWESVAKVYASPEGIAKTRANHQLQCESLRTAKANGEVSSRRWKLEPAA